MVVYDDTSNEPVRVFDSSAVLPGPTDFGQYKMTYRTGEIVSPPVDAIEPLQLELSDFCGAILRGVSPRSSAAIGIEVLGMIEAVDEALEVESYAR
jgi:hypothetical protein